jgi:subtilase family serine protease
MQPLFALRGVTHRGRRLIAGALIVAGALTTGLATSAHAVIEPPTEDYRLPDLVIKEISDAQVAGSDVYVVVKNIGTKTAGSSTLRVTDVNNVSRFRDYLVPSLASGQSHRVGVTYWGNGGLYSHKADYRRQVWESNESNNSKTQSYLAY